MIYICKNSLSCSEFVKKKKFLIKKILNAFEFLLNGSLQMQLHCARNELVCFIPIVNELVCFIPITCE